MTRHEANVMVINALICPCLTDFGRQMLHSFKCMYANGKCCACS